MMRHGCLLALIVAAPLVACGGSVEAESTAARSSQALSARMLTTCTAGRRQVAPAISGTRVVFTDVVTPGTIASSDLNVWLLDITSNDPPVALTSSQDGLNFLPDIGGDVVAFTRVNPGRLGDIVAIDLRWHAEWTAAAASQFSNFELPSVGGSFLTYIRRTANGGDIEAYDLTTGGVPPPITNDVALQGSPRTDGSWIVYEDYASAKPAVKAFSIATGWPAIDVTDGTSSATAPDVDGGVVVYVARVAGADQIFLFDTVTRMSTQLTSTPSVKLWPRISAGRVVWTDDRNGTLDVFGYDIATRTEVALATGAAYEYSPDIDGDRVVYETTENETGCTQIALLTFPKITPPATVGSISDDVRDLFGSGDIKNQGLTNALLSKLASAAAKRAAGDCGTAAAIYQAFISQVTAQSGKGISTTAAASLIADAQYLIDHCP